MSTLSTNDVCEVTMFGRMSGQAILNVFHYVYEGTAITTPAGYNTEMDQLAAAFRTNVWNHASGIRVNVMNAYTLEYIRAQKVAVNRSWFSDLAVNEQGSNVLVIGDPLPQNVHLTMTLRGNRTGRGVQGSKRFAGLASGSLQNGVWSVPTTQQWAAVGGRVATDLPGSIGFSTFYPIIWNARTPNLRNKIRQVAIQSTVRIDRRRTVGLGI